MKEVPPRNPIFWVIFLLQNLGRFTYKVIFYLLKFTFPATSHFLKVILKFGFGLTTTLLASIKVLKATIKYQKWLRKKKKKKKITIVWQARKRKTSFPKIKIPIAALVTPCFLAAGIITFYYFILKDLPSPNRLITRHQAVSTKIYDRNGQLLFTIYNGNQNRTLVKIDQIPQQLKDATIAIEDKDFYHHQGFSIRGIFRAIERNVLQHSVEGGSTITQQLVKNALLSPEKTLTRKVRELILSLEVELLFSKNEILQLYFNEIPYGGTAYGVEAAAKTYFGKNVSDLDLAESALLAGLPAAPTQFSPFGTNPQMAFIRQKEVLARMVESGFITTDQARAVVEEKIIFAPQTTDIKAPHFVMYVKDLLVSKYGLRQVEEGGLEVITSLDQSIQDMVQVEVASEVGKLENFHVTNGAALVTIPRTGEILAMVGSKDYFNAQAQGNVNVTTSPRQPGSAIKVVNYAVALQNGYTPSTIIADSPVVYSIPGSIPYAPVNYDGRFHGNVTLRTALGSSYNVPAVKVLASYGVDKMVAMGKLLGITTWNDSSRFGLSLTLGAGEVKLTDMTVVYGTLANMGKKVNLQPILKVTDYQGRILERSECNDFSPGNCQYQQVLPAQVAYLLTDILADNGARTPAFGPNSLLVIPGQQVAVKTGTTNEKRDNWTIGFTPELLAAVWVGNNDNSPMSAVASGITGASPIWHNIMANLLKDKQANKFTKPEGLLAIPVCSLNGLLPCEGCPSKLEYYAPGTEPKTHCDPQQIKKLLEEKNSPTPQPQP